MSLLPKLASVKKTIQRFYFLKASLLLWYAWNFFQYRSVDEALWLWPVAWLSAFSDTSVAIGIVIVLGIGLGLAAMIRPFNVIVKSLEAVFFFLFMAINFSFGKIDHGVHGIILASLFVALMSHQKQETENLDERNDLLLRSGIGVFLFTYFLSGLWKFRFAAEAVLQAESIAPLKGALSYQLAVNMLNSGEKMPLAMGLMGLGDLWQLAIWLGVIAFELMSLVVIFKPGTYRTWGVLLIIFHQLVYFSMGISFIEAQLLALILLVSGPYPHRLLVKA